MGSTLAEKLERLQKRAARVVLREGSSNDPVLQLAWTKLLIRRQQHLCTFIFKRFQGFVGTELFFSLYSQSAIIIKRRAMNLMLYFRLCRLNLEKNNYVPGSKDLQ